MRHSILLLGARLYVRPFLLVTTSLLVSLGLYHVYQWEQGYWLVWSAVFSSLVTTSYRIWRRSAYISFLGVSAAVLTAIAALCAHNIALLAAFLFIVTFAAVYLEVRFVKVFWVPFIINLLAIVAGSLSVSFSGDMQRAGFVLAGTGLALILNFLLWPHRANRLRLMETRCLFVLAKMCKMIFSCLLFDDYQQRYIQYERNIEALRVRILELMPMSPDHSTRREAILQPLCEIVIDLGRLRYQVEDHTIFNVCARELAEISQAMQTVLYQLAAGNKPDLQRLHISIESLADTYRAALEVVSREPFAFFLFLYKLRLFYASCEKLGGERE